MKPLISVIIPTFNRDKYIKLAVESALEQTYSNIEVLVVDDGSTDSTRDILLQIDDRRFRYIRTQNQGNYFARNTGLAQAKGEFIAFLDSDDRFLPEKLSLQMRRFEEQPDLGLCCSNVYVRHYDIPDKVFEDSAHSFDHDIDNNGGFIAKAIESNFIATSSVLIRKECVDRLGYFSTQFQNAMDYEYFLRIIFNFPALYLKDKLVERLIHPKAVSSNSMMTNNALVYIFTDCAENFQRGKMFAESHREILIDARERSIYMAGLEHLLKYQFDDAIECLEKTRFKKKLLFKSLSLFIAKYRCSAIIPVIAKYRNYRNYISLHRNPVPRQETGVTAKLMAR